MVLLTLASPSQLLIHAVLLTGIFALFRCWHNHKKQMQSATRIGLFKLSGIAMIAFLLSAPATLPATLEFANMIRWLGPQATVTGFDRMPFEAFLTDQLTVAELGGVLVKLTPKLVGSQFAGPIVVTLAIFAFISRERSWIALAKSHYLNNDGPALNMAIKRVVDLDPRHEFRLIFEGRIDKQMASMLASYQNVRTLSAYFNPAPLRQFQELYHHGPRTDSYLQILGARYLLCRDCAGEEYHGFRFRETVHGYDLHEASNALPYAQVVQRVDGRFDNLAGFISKTASHDLSRGLLFIETDETIAIDRMASTSEDCIVREDIRKNNRIRYLLSCRSAGVLILNEFYAGPWRVTVNDVASDVLRVNGNQIGVEVGPGDHAIEFSYRPGSFLLSIGLAAIGVAMALLWALWPRRETRF